MAQHLPPDPTTVTASAYDCSYVRAHLDAFVDGELVSYSLDGQSHTAILGAHLATCHACASLERQIRGMRRALRSLGTREHQLLKAPSTLRARVAAMLSSS